jgi:hypothetical protein
LRQGLTMFVAQTGLELTILLPLPPKYWDYRHAPSHLARRFFFYFLNFFTWQKNVYMRHVYVRCICDMYVRCICEVYMWGIYVTCMWGVYVTCICDVYMWGVYVKCICEVYMWRVCEVYMWGLYVTCICEVYMWHVCEVYMWHVYVRCICDMYVRCICEVYMWGVYVTCICDVYVRCTTYYCFLMRWGDLTMWLRLVLKSWAQVSSCFSVLSRGHQACCQHTLVNMMFI